MGPPSAQKLTIMRAAPVGPEATGIIKKASEVAAAKQSAQNGLEAVQLYVLKDLITPAVPAGRDIETSGGGGVGILNISAHQ